MTDRTRLTALLAVLLVGAAIAPAVTAGSAAATAVQPQLQTQAQTIETGAADLAIEQPDWAESEVKRTTENGTAVYTVTGRDFDIVPRNFNHSRVVDYGVREDAGRLRYDDEFGQYELEATAKGSYHVYWTVVETRTVEVPVNETATNTTSNTSTNETRTVTETTKTRYEAIIRVENDPVVHVAEGTVEQYRSDAENWTAFEETIYEISGEDANVEAVLNNKVIPAYRLRENPTSAFGGRFGEILTILFVSLSGLFLVGAWLAREAITTYIMWARIRVKEALDSDRAEIEAQLDAVDQAERRQDQVNTDLVDIFADPDVAYSTRQATGAENEREFWTHMNQHFGPANLQHYLVQAAALCDYGLGISYDPVADALQGRLLKPEEDPAGDEFRVELLETVEYPEDFDSTDRQAEVVDRVDDLLQYIDPNDPTLAEFEPAEHDYDRAQLESRVDGPTDLEGLAEELSLQRTEFDDETVQRMLLQVIEDVERRPLTDKDGRPDPIRATLSEMLVAAAKGDDLHQTPTTAWWRRVLEDMLRNHDPTEQARTVARQSREGRLHGD